LGSRGWTEATGKLTDNFATGQRFACFANGWLFDKPCREPHYRQASGPTLYLIAHGNRSDFTARGKAWFSNGFCRAR
jgi:hypothetical protein